MKPLILPGEILCLVKKELKPKFTDTKPIVNYVMVSSVAPRGMTVPYGDVESGSAIIFANKESAETGEYDYWTKGEDGNAGHTHTVLRMERLNGEQIKLSAFIEGLPEE